MLKLVKNFQLSIQLYEMSTNYFFNFYIEEEIIFRMYSQILRVDYGFSASRPVID